MDQAKVRKVARKPSEPTVASILGVKGQLRFHPHGSTQKAHVVLRQVEISTEESDDEADSTTIYFSLFAQKRIEVKPGKEILLAVATPDGRYLDTPVIFAARSTGDDADLDDDVSKSAQVESATPLPHTLPPKMRKTWSKRSNAQSQSKSASVLSRVYASVGIQAGVSDSPPPDEENSPEEDSVSSEHERSLSPMELDSAPSSPLLPSPEPLPEPARHMPEGTKSTSFSPPGLWVSTSPPHPQALVTETNIPSLSLSPDSDNPPGLSSLSLPPLPPARHVIDQVNVAESDTVTPLTGAPSGTIVPATHVPGTVAVASKPSSVPLTSAGEAEHLAIKPTPSPTPSATPYVPKRRTVPNPFVSGGLLTDFVSSSVKSTPDISPQEPHTNGLHDIQLAEQSQKSTPSPLPTTNALDSLLSHTRHTISPPVRRSPVRRTPTPEFSAAPSSSKVKIEDTLPAPPLPQQAPMSSLTAAYDPTRPDLQLPVGPARFPPMAMPNFPPNLVRPPPPPPPSGEWSNGHINMPSMSRRRSPPPDSKPQSSYVPTNPFSNPLGIRPAVPGPWQRDSFSPSVPPPPASAPPTSSGKKPVPIGNGWPHSRQPNGHTPKSRRRSSAKATSFVPASRSNPVVPSVDSPATVNGATGSFTPTANFASPTLALDVHHNESRSEYEYSTTTHVNGVPLPMKSPKSELPGQNMMTTSAPIPLSASNATPITVHNTPVLPGSVPSSAHPLPPKPPAFAGPSGTWSPSMGVKRMGSPGLQSQSPEPRRAKVFNWPTSEAVYSLRLQSDSDAGIRTINHNSDGSLCAVTCHDKSVRILSTKTRTELAKLAHNMQVTAVAWMDRDAGVITLGENGIVSTWTRSAGNKWQWAKILDASADRRADDDPGCLAFGRDRIAIAYPRTGVKVWLFIKGTWLPQRSILRQNVTAIKFVEDGEALIGGTTDGVLWYCQVPNGTLRAYSFMKSKVYTLDVDPRGSHALAAQTGGRSHLVNISQDDQKGKVEQVYTLKESDPQTDVSYDFGAMFAARGQRLLFGAAQGCIMVWDRKSGEVIHGLVHGEDHTVQAVSCFDGGQAAEGHILTGTRQGQLTWFSQPPADGNGTRTAW
ncbi:hypothetical protein BDW22DRAFT_1370783 [Trametopsis cervina]|nr:hypothetical protein BDW22DRAFT_1370783 [Trametopsis cervina]